MFGSGAIGTMGGSNSRVKTVTIVPLAMLRATTTSSGKREPLRM